MAEQGVDICHVVQAPDLDSSVSPAAEQLMSAIPERQACDDILMTRAAA